MALENNFSNLSDNGFGSGSEQGGLSGIRFGTIVDDIVSGDPVFPEHVVRLYQVLSADTVDAEVGIDGLVAAQNVKVNEKLLTDDLEIEGNFTLSGGLTVPGNLTVEGNVSVEGDFEFSDASSNFGTNATEAIENAFNDSSDATFTFSGGQIDVSLNDNTVDEDEINASGSGFLSNSGGSLSYDGLNTSGEFNGDGTSGNQLSIASNAIGDAELENMPDGSMKVGDGGDPYNLELGSDAVPVSTTEVGGTNIVGANINSEQVLGRAGSGGITALTIEDDVKPLLRLEAEDINAGTFNQGSQQFSFDDRVNFLSDSGAGSMLLSGDARINFRNAGGDNSAFIELGEPFNDGKLLIDNTSAQDDDGIDIITNGGVDLETGSAVKIARANNPALQFDDLDDFTVPAEIYYDTNGDIASDSPLGLFRITSDENIRMDANEDILIEPGERAMIDTNAPVLIGNGFSDFESVEEQIDDADIVIYDGFIIFKENGQHSRDTVDLNDTKWFYDGSNIQLMKKGEAAIFGDEDSDSDTDLGWIENEGGGSTNKEDTF